ncbi:oxidoreductase [Paenibacillus sp. ACRRY]|uniref:oxidoreductase n=1 Tax=Paenibacillus sp. ACRRY TaxID=2918208 RepID=UPI001EF4E63B|nr:oxidoreductase [Paenibacillus sp. ACRRY]MCG7385138.1 oxidoreductase [Paenibacillus sp. ACRRY]
MTQIKSSGENGEKIKQILLYCETKEDPLHTRLAGILNELWDVPGVSKDLLSEIEDLYIQKGEVYCTVAYEAGYQDAVKTMKTANM